MQNYDISTFPRHSPQQGARCPGTGTQNYRVCRILATLTSLEGTDAKELCSDRTPHGSSLSMLHTDFVTNPNNPADDNPGKDPLTGHNTLAC